MLHEESSMKRRFFWSEDEGEREEDPKRGKSLLRGRKKDT